MSEVRERSAIFKFFYVILSVITFPIFLVLFLFKHPISFLFVLLMLGCGLIYFPMSKGVAFDDIGSWYMEKYHTIKIQTVSKALDSGAANFVPEALSSDVKRLQQEYKEEIEEAKMPKGENYNKKVIRDKRIEETKAVLKKRSGFKKKTSETEDALESTTDKAVLLEESGVKAGGLAEFLKKEEATLEVTEDNAPKMIEKKEVEKPVADVEEVVVVPEVKAEDMPNEQPEKAQKNDDDLELDLF